MATGPIPSFRRPDFTRDVSLSDNEDNHCVSAVDPHHLLIRKGPPRYDDEHATSAQPRIKHISFSCGESPPTFDSPSDYQFTEWNSFPHDDSDSLSPDMRRPIIYNSDYGPTVVWAMNVFTLPHNAIRAECAALIALVDVISANFERLDDSDVDDIHAWWTTFQIFIVEHFNFEADVLFPCAFPTTASFNTVVRLPEANLIRGDLPAPDLSLKKSLQMKRDAILSLIGHLNSSFAVRRCSDLLNVLGDISNDVGMLVPLILDYFETAEDMLPTLLLRLYTASAERVLLRRYIEHMRRGQAPNLNFALLVAWMDADKRGEWVRTNFGGWARWRFQRWDARCFRLHVDIPSRLSRKIKKKTTRSLRKRRGHDLSIDRDAMRRSVSTSVGSHGPDIDVQVND